ncbi:MAG: site-2 protease family protein [Legionellales bacterium]|nr:site-2 protease family protein [Legionellales bacterium]
MSELSIIQQIVIWLLPILFAITLHEVAHGWVAYRLGDPTAKLLGRLTLNPLRHIDWLGTVLLPILILIISQFQFTFGWAKPVPVNAHNLRSQRQMIYVAAAGPLANFLMAIAWAVIARLGVAWDPQIHSFALFMVYAGHAGVLINLVLMVLNLLPIPPLDGSRVISHLLPARYAYLYNKIEPFGFLILLVLLVTGLLKYLLIPPVYFLSKFISQLVGF